jgi:hypothetical protein
MVSGDSPSPGLARVFDALAAYELPEITREELLALARFRDEVELVFSRACAAFNAEEMWSKTAIPPASPGSATRPSWQAE